MNRYDALAEKSEIAVLCCRVECAVNPEELHAALDDFTAYLTWFKKATDGAQTAPVATARIAQKLEIPSLPDGSLPAFNALE